MAANFGYVLAVLIGLCFILNFAIGDPNTGMVYIACSNDQFDPQDPFLKSLNYVLSDVVSHTATHGYDFYSTSPWQDAKAYAHAACNGAIPNADCGACLSVVYTKLLNLCAFRFGGQLQVQDCRVRYERYPFAE